MSDNTAAHRAAEAVLNPAEADRRKAALRQLRDELAARGVESVLIGRHALRLNAAGPWSQSGPVNPQLHIGDPGSRRIVTTDTQRYQLPDGAAHDADDPAGAADHVAAGLRDQARPAKPASDSPAAPDRVAGPGERALCQLIDDGII